MVYGEEEKPTINLFYSAFFGLNQKKITQSLAEQEKLPPFYTKISFFLLTS